MSVYGQAKCTVTCCKQTKTNLERRALVVLLLISMSLGALINAYYLQGSFM